MQACCRDSLQISQFGAVESFSLISIQKKRNSALPNEIESIIISLEK
jgi:hypothetical protein